jgi:hypothetical protein
MPDYHYLLTVVIAGEVKQKLPHPAGSVSVTFATREGLVDMQRLGWIDLCARTLGELAIVAFPEAGVTNDRPTAFTKGDLGRMV